MTTGALLDLLVLLGVAAIPAALALFLLRRGLASPGPRFWRAATAGVVPLSGLAVLAVWGATVFASDEIARCEAANNPALLDCADNSLWVAVAGVPALACLVFFIAGAAAFLIARQLRRAG